MVREAIDTSLGLPTREERVASFEAIAAMRGRYLTPDEIEEIIAEEREANVKLCSFFLDANVIIYTGSDAHGDACRAILGAVRLRRRRA